jgi:hypothetical protein
MFKKFYHWTQSSHLDYLRSILILSCYLCPDLPSALFPSCVLMEILYTFVIFSCVLNVTCISSSLIWSFWCYLGKLLIVDFSPTFCYLSFLGSDILQDFRVPRWCSWKSLFAWDVTWYGLVVGYRGFGTTCSFRRISGPLKMDWWIVLKCR